MKNELFEKKSVLLLHGYFTEDTIAQIKKRKFKNIVVMEGRPSLASARQTMKMLASTRLEPTVISDNMAGSLFFNDLVKEVWIDYRDNSSSSITSQIGSLILAILAKKHKVPVRAFESSDLSSDIIGKSKDLIYFNGVHVAAKGIQTYVPLVDQIPRRLITECVT